MSRALDAPARGAQGDRLLPPVTNAADAITIGANLDPGLIPDSERIVAHLRESFAELSALAGIDPATRRESVHPQQQRRTAVGQSAAGERFAR